MTKLVDYYRVSTIKQEESELGLKAQRAEVQRFRSACDGILVGTYTEVETGKSADRPELQKAIRHARAAGATLVVAKLDRLARNVAFTSALMDSGLDFVCCDNPNANRLTIHILAAVAEEEGRLISERTKAGLAAAKAEGKLLGSARPGHWEGREHLRGWRAGLTRARERSAARFRERYGEIIPLIRGLRNAGLTFEAIAAHLNAEGYITSRGCPFNRTQVYRLFSRQTLQEAT